MHGLVAFTAVLAIFLCCTSESWLERILATSAAVILTLTTFAM